MVGVQTYEQQDLNLLRYAARDAERVFQQIGKVTDLDLDRSRLLVTAAGRAEAEGHVLRSESLSENEIRTEFRRFLSRIRSDDTVFLYFGGHGTEWAQEPLFLPSDYVREPQNHYLRLDEIVNEIRGELNQRQLRDVNIVLFANMCGAGAGAGVMSVGDDLDTQFVKDWLGRHTLGFERFAFFPATAPGQDTYESEQHDGSLFAHHLLAGLQGSAAANGVITSGSLFGYLDDQIEDDLPRHPQFDPEILVGVGSMAEGAVEYALGLSLLAVAMDHESDGPVLDLASHLFASAADKNWRLSSIATFRRAETSAVRGDDRAAVQSILRQAIESHGLSQPLRQRITEWLDRATQAKGRFESLSQLSRYLREGGEFYALSLTHRSSAADDAFLNGLIQRLRSLPGLRDYAVVPVDVPTGAGAVRSLRETVERWTAGLTSPAAGSAPPPHLLVVGPTSASLRAGRLLPLGAREFAEVIAPWPGSKTIAYLGPFGGYLLRDWKEELDEGVSILVAASELNGMTFSGPTGGTAALMIEGMLAGIDDLEEWDVFQDYLQEFSKPGRDHLLEEQWVVGTPTWLPDQFSASWPPADLVEKDLHPLRRWSVLLAAGCDTDLLDVCWENLDAGFGGARDSPASGVKVDPLVLEAVRPNVQDRGDLAPFVDLQRAVEAELRGETVGATAGYRSFATAMARLPLKQSASDGGLDRELVAKLRRVGDAFSEVAQRRASAVENSSHHRFFYLSVSVDDYESPLVVDLTSSRKDAESWASLLSSRFGSALEVVPTLVDPASKQDILGYLREGLSRVGSDDLAILVYTGRGYERAGRRYLVPAGVDRPDFSAAWDVSQMLDLWEIAEEAKDRWLVAVYDTQFVSPTVAAEKLDIHFEKHLDSVRPSLPPAETTRREPLRFVPAGMDLPSHQIHVWWEGRVTDAGGRTPAGCSDGTTFGSPLSYSLAKRLRAETYRTWTTTAREDPCLSSTSGDPGGQLVVQGALDVPFFATGEAAELVAYLGSDLARKELNLRSALQLAEELNARGARPASILSKVVLLDALVELSFQLPGHARFGREVDRWRVEAVRMMEDLKGLKVTLSGLERTYLDTLTRTLILDGRIEEARLTLVDAPGEILAAWNLAERLIDVTEEALRGERTSIASATEEKMREIIDSTVGEDIKPLLARWEDLRSLAVSPSTRPYSLGPPSPDSLAGDGSEKRR